jgi:hypothetical protein
VWHQCFNGTARDSKEPAKRRALKQQGRGQKRLRAPQGLHAQVRLQKVNGLQGVQQAALQAVHINSLPQILQGLCAAHLQAHREGAVCLQLLRALWQMHAYTLALFGRKCPAPGQKTLA